MKTSAALLMACLFIGSALSKTDLKDSVSLDIMYTTKNGLGYEYSSSHLNYNTDKKEPGPQIKLRPDLSYSEVVVGLKDSSAQWGVYCTASPNTNTSNNCVYNDKEAQAMYSNNKFTYKSGSLFAPLVSKVDTGAGKLDTRLLVNPPKDQWIMDEAGVWGLAPKTDNKFFNYVFSQYNLDNTRGGKQAFDFSMIYFNYKTDDKFKGANDDTWSYSTLTLNGFEERRVDDSVSKVEIGIDNSQATAGFWTISGIDLLVKDKATTLTKKVACLSNTQNSMFALSDADKAVFVKQVSQGACGKDSCKWDEAKDYSVTLQFPVESNTVNVILKSEDFTYNDNGNLGFSVGNLNDWQRDGMCSDQHTLGLGRLFFSKMHVTFTVIRDSDTSLAFKMTLAKLRPVDKITNSERLVLLLFGLTLILAIVGTIIYKVTRKDVSEGAYRAGETA